MSTYTRTYSGHTMTVHAPLAGTFDAATREAFAAFVAGESVLGLDVETSAIEDRGPRHFAEGFTVRLVQFGSETAAWVLDPADPGQRAAIETVLSDPARHFVTHTAYDVLAVWVVFGIALGQRVVDAHLVSKLIDPDERAGHGLKELCERHLDDGLVVARDALYARMRALAPVGHRAGEAWKRWGWNHLPATEETYVVYAGLDAVYVRRLLPILLKACAPYAHLVAREAWLAAQSVGIAVRGLLLDRPYTLNLLRELEAEYAAAEASITSALGIKGRSPKFAAWLDEQTTRAGITGLPRTDNGQLQTSADSLAALLAEHAAALPATVVELVTARLSMARISNLIGNLRAFLDHADADGRVHPQINTLRAKTARMSITGPALQTLKKHDPRLRRCFRADPGHVLISCDFSQVEVRVAAALSGDATLKQVIDSGADIHDATATLMYGEGFTPEQRTISKRCTFGTLYGGGARALAEQTGVSEATARQVIEKWRQTYPQVIAYGHRLAELPEVVTASGRHIPADPVRGYANGNYAVQSTARDLLLAAVYRFVTRHQASGLWLFVHDEAIVQAREADAERVRADLQQAMTTAFRGVPILAEAEILGTHWGKLPEVELADEEAPTPPETAAPFRMLVTGSRTWTDADLIGERLHDVADNQARGRDLVIVHGACPRGADAIAAAFCASEAEGFEREGRALIEERHPADWDRLGKRAGFERNAAMVAAGADVCLAFIRNDSRGASHTADLAEHAGIPTIRYRHDEAPHRPHPSASPDLLTIALACAARGWRVFPIRPRAKRPPWVSNWEPRATTDRERIRRCWGHGPYNVGIATGPSNLVVIDLDVPKPGQVPPPEWARPGIGEGADVLADLCEQHGQPFPFGTFTVRTPSGGWHLYFTCPPGLELRNSNGEHGRGLGWLIDVRAGGGYAVAPNCPIELDDGSVGVYTVTDDSPPAVLPEWLSGLLTRAPNEISPLGCIGSSAGQVSDLDAYTGSALKGEIARVRAAAVGGRNHALNKAAYNLGRLVGAGLLDYDHAATVLYDAASVHFGPTSADVRPADAQATIRSALAAGARRPRHLSTRETAA